jgi:hypothetical protein
MKKHNKRGRNRRTAARRPTRFDELVAAGLIRPPQEQGDPLEGCPDIHLPRGTAAELVALDRKDSSSQPD